MYVSSYYVLGGSGYMSCMYMHDCSKLLDRDELTCIGMIMF